MGAGAPINIALTFGTNSGATTAITSTVPVGSLIIIVVGTDTANQSITGLTLSSGDVPVQAVQSTPTASTDNVSIWYVLSSANNWPSGGTFTATTSSGQYGAGAYYVSGANASALDQTNSAVGNGLSASFSTAALTQATELAVISNYGTLGFTTYVPATGFVQVGAFLDYKFTNSTTAITNNASWTATQHWAAAIATFKIAAPTPPYQRLAAGFPFPAYVDENSSYQRLAPGVYVNQTSPTNVQHVLSVATASAEVVAAIKASTKGLALAISQAQSIKALKAVSKITSAASTEIVAVFKAVSRKILVSQAQSLRTLKSVSRLFSVTQAQVISALRVKAASVATALAQIVRVTRQASRGLSIASPSLVGVVKQPNLRRGTTDSNTASVVAQKSKLLSLNAVQAEVVSFFRALGKSFGVAETLQVNVLRTLLKFVSTAQAQFVSLVSKKPPAPIKLSITTPEALNVFRATGKAVSLTQAQGISALLLKARNLFFGTFLTQQVSLTAGKSLSAFVRVTQNQVLSVFKLVTLFLGVAQQAAIGLIVWPRPRPTPPVPPTPPIEVFVQENWWEKIHRPQTAKPTGPNPLTPNFVLSNWWRKIHKPDTVE